MDNYRSHNNWNYKSMITLPKEILWSFLSVTPFRAGFRDNNKGYINVFRTIKRHTYIHLLKCMIFQKTKKLLTFHSFLLKSMSYEAE